MFVLFPSFAERHMVEATFGGVGGSLGEYLSANQPAWSFVSTAESFELSFRTKLPNGLLLYSGNVDEDDQDDGQADGPDYLQLALVDAGLTLKMKLGSGSVQEVRVAPSKVRFDDHQWHTVTVLRKIREVSARQFDGFMVYCHYSTRVLVVYPTCRYNTLTSTRLEMHTYTVTCQLTGKLMITALLFFSLPRDRCRFHPQPTSVM